MNIINYLNFSQPERAESEYKKWIQMNEMQSVTLCIIVVFGLFCYLCSVLTLIKHLKLRSYSRSERNM